jgi:hypothetical protein
LLKFNRIIAPHAGFTAHQVVTHFEIRPGLNSNMTVLPWDMPKRSSNPKRPRDPNQLAKLIVDLSTGEAEEPAEARRMFLAKTRRRFRLAGAAS